ncbi:MAG: hypothetical protein RIR43_1466 [Pseudomonadota bacterium]
MITGIATPMARAAATATGTDGPALSPSTPHVSAPSRTLLQLMWLASPALPVGGFSYSEGLEAAVDAGLVRDEDSAMRWLHDQLQLVLVRSEWPAVARAQAAFVVSPMGDPIGVKAANDWVLHTRESRELRLQTEQMGRSLAEWLRQRAPDEPRVALLQALLPAPTWPVAFALAGALSGAGLREVLLAHGFGWAENLVQAAIKCMPLGQSAGQRLLQTLADALPAAVDAALAQASDQAQAYAPGLAILSAQHEQQYSRLFRS